MRGPGPRARRLLLGAGGVVLVGGIVAGGLVAAGTAGLIPADLGSVLAPPQVSPSPEPTASAPALTALQMPVQGQCTACHLTADGGIGTNPIPAIAHPLHGFEQCTACHATGSLVATAPGHSGIHADQCLLCHTQTTAAAPPRPHPEASDLDCLSCHGSIAPLPTSMATRSATDCWVCHQSSTTQAPRFPHPIPADGTCTSCHTAARVGALPADHAGRTDAVCTECHQQATSVTAPAAPHELSSRFEPCTFCHGQSTTTALP